MAYTVKPLLTGHPWGNWRWPLNGGWCTLNIFHHQVNSLVNIESLQDNHDKLVLEYFYHLSPSISDSYLPLHFPKQEILDGRLIGVKIIEKTLSVAVSPY